MVLETCLTSWFNELCSGHGTCINHTCVCDEGWSGNGPFYSVDGKDCSIHIHTVQILNSVASAACCLMTIVSIIGVWLSRHKLTIYPLTKNSPDKILVSSIFLNISGAMLFTCFAKGYFIHEYWGVWFLSVVYWAALMLQLYYMINFIINITYKLKSGHAPMAKALAIITTVLVIVTDIIFVLIVIFHTPAIHVIIIRILNASWVVWGLFNSFLIMYYGARIEQVLQANPTNNQREIKSLRIVRYTFALAIFSCSMGMYPIFILFPMIMNWIFPLMLAVMPISYFYFWHVKIIKKKMGLIESSKSQDKKVSSDQNAQATSIKPLEVES